MSNQYDPEYIKGLFNKMSASYERMNFITSFGFSIRWRKQFLKSIPETKDPIILLDLMTGMGETWGPLKKRFPNSKFSALDFSEGMMQYAESKNLKKFNNKVSLLNQNVLENDLPNDHYDVIVSAFGLKTFNNDQIKVLAKEIKRVLKPGGTFSFIEVSKPDNKTLHFFYRLHLKHVVPICGKLMLGNPEEYRMLWKYTSAYENSKEAFEIFKNEGLEVEFKNYFGGCATGVFGKKTAPNQD